MVSKINLIELATGQAGKEILINENLARLESFCFPVLSIANTPPANPADLDSYIVGSNPTGLWTGYANYWVCFVNGGWVLAPPSSRMFLFDVSSNSFYNWNGTAWIVVPVGSTFSGSYNDLTDKPILFSGSYNDLTDKPILFSGSYNDLTDKPILFSGSYNDLTDKPFSAPSGPSLILGSTGGGNALTWRLDHGTVVEERNARWAMTGSDLGKLIVVDTDTVPDSVFYIDVSTNVSFLSYNFNFYFYNKGSKPIYFEGGTGWTFPNGNRIPPYTFARCINTGDLEWSVFLLGTNLQSKGQLLVGTNAGATGANFLELGTNGQVLTVDSTTDLGVKWADVSGGVTSPLTTKGDIWSYSTTDARLGVGTNGQVLKANSATATGLQWGAIAYSEITGAPTLGTAAALDVGTSANNVVQLDGSAKLPAVDGSQLTNLPVGGVPYQSFKANQTSNYTIQQSDHGTWIPCATNDLTITLPDGLATGTQVILDRRGTATVTVTASTTLIGKNVSANSVQIANQYGVVHCVHQGSNIWRITGDL